MNNTYCDSCGSHQTDLSWLDRGCWSCGNRSFTNLSGILTDIFRRLKALEGRG